MDSSSFPANKNFKKGDEVEETEDHFRPHDSRNKRKDISGTSTACSLPSKSKKQMNARSQVWEHYTRTVENNDKCKCHYCGRIFVCPTSTGTSNLQKHLNSCKQYKVWQESQTQPILTPQGGNLKMSKVSEDVFREASNQMLVLGELPLSFIESSDWRHFCSRVNLYKPHSRRTTTRDIVEMYVKRKADMRNVLAANKQRVSLTTDIWVAPTTGASYMVITVHFIDASWRLRKLIIGFKYIIDHKGATISSVLLECLAEWGIEKVFTITVDNATANTSALKKFQNSFKLLGNDALVLDGEFMHMRCCAHILNLIVKDGLQEVDHNVAAIRNAVQYVRSSSTRLKSFELRVETGKMTRGSLPLDCKTRWNSTYLMLTRASKFRLAFDKMEAEDKLYNDYFQEVDNGKKRIGPPTLNDWNAVERLVRFLIIFYNSTLVVSASNSVNSYKCYNEICTIEKNLISLSNNLDIELRIKAYDMREKFDKYWDGLQKINRLLIVASVFDPRNKMHFAQLCFDKLYGKDSAESKELYDSVIDVLCRLFKEYNRMFTKVSSGGPSSSSQSARTSYDHSGHWPGQDHVAGEGPDGIDKMDLADDDHGYERMDFVYKEMVNEKGLQDARDELEIYLKETVENPKTNIPGLEYDVLSWWRLNSPKFPILSEIARDVLAMQVSSVASESAFSTSGRILEPYRSCLTHYMIEVLMCMEQWMKSEIHLSEIGVLTNQQMLADIELQDRLEREFDSQSML